MDDYTREMMDLKTLLTRTLEKKGVLAKIRAELRASVLEAIEEEDRGKKKVYLLHYWVAATTVLSNYITLLQEGF